MDLWGIPRRLNFDVAKTRSCPSRKFPCKHALALLFLYADQVARLTSQNEPPQWVTEWIKGRKERASKKEERAEKLASAPPADLKKQAAATAKRQNTRWKRMESGARELQRWLNDQFQQGFATFDPNHYQDWYTMAARMVDAQAPGLGRMLQDALSLMQSGTAHQQEAIEQLGLMQILISATLRRDELSPERQADIQTALGWALEKDEVLAGSEHVTDNWLVLGQITEEIDSKLTEHRIWLYGEKTQQYALLLDFAFKGQGLELAWANQFSYQATLAYYPGSTPLRAIVVGQSTKYKQNQCPQFGMQLDIEENIDQSSTLLAGNPWLPRVPVVIPEALPIKYEDEWMIKTSEGCFTLQINDTNMWSFMAFSAGFPVTVFAEWNGYKFFPLTALVLKNSSACWAYADGSNSVVS